MDCSLPASLVHGAFQARILEWIAISYSGDLPNLGIELTSLVSPALAGEFFTTEPPGKPLRSMLSLYKIVFQTNYLISLQISLPFSPSLIVGQLTTF